MTAATAIKIVEVGDNDEEVCMMPGQVQYYPKDEGRGNVNEMTKGRGGDGDYTNK